MAKKKKGIWSRELKVSAVKRMLAGENTTALAKELKVRRTLLYRWRESYRKDGANAFRNRKGRPAKSRSRPAEAASELAAAKQRVAELERKIGQQQVDLDFFQRALRQVGATPGNRPGAKPSTASSKR
jgi:transposase-like protein